MNKMLVTILLFFCVSFSWVFAQDLPTGDDIPIPTPRPSQGEPCNTSDCINSSNFTINVNDFTPGNNADAVRGDSVATVNNVLGTRNVFGYNYANQPDMNGTF